MVAAESLGLTNPAFDRKAGSCRSPRIDAFEYRASGSTIGSTCWPTVPAVVGDAVQILSATASDPAESTFNAPNVSDRPKRVFNASATSRVSLGASVNDAWGAPELLSLSCAQNVSVTVTGESDTLAIVRSLAKRAPPTPVTREATGKRSAEAGCSEGK